MNRKLRAPAACVTVLLLMSSFVPCFPAQELPGSKPSQNTGREREPRRPQGGGVAVTESLDRKAAELGTVPPRTRIDVQVKYNKEYGYQADWGRFGNPGPTSCDAFSVLARPDNGVRPEKPIVVTPPNKMRGGEGYYTCNYVILDLPLQVPIKVNVALADERSAPTETWKGGGQPQPPAGQRRIILDGTRTVTLTDIKQPLALTFEMVYASTQPRPGIELQRRGPYVRP